MEMLWNFDIFCPVWIFIYCYTPFMLELWPSCNINKFLQNHFINLSNMSSFYFPGASFFLFFPTTRTKKKKSLQLYIVLSMVEIWLYGDISFCVYDLQIVSFFFIRILGKRHTRISQFNRVSISGSLGVIYSLIWVSNFQNVMLLLLLNTYVMQLPLKPWYNLSKPYWIMQGFCLTGRGFF
jgi:hypothetical protein